MEQENNPPKPVLVLPRPPAETDPAPLTRETLADYAEDQLIQNAQKLVPRMFRSAARRLVAKDSNVQAKAFDQVAQIYGYVRATPGVAINLLQQNNNYVGSNDGVYFEKIVRMMEETERPSRDEDPTIIDVEADQ
jgi:hypothetical protein